MGFLEKVIAFQLARVRASQEVRSLDLLIKKWELRCASEAAQSSSTPGRSFLKAVTDPGMSLIAEIKRASPSRGIIAPGLSVAVQAGLYQQAGARAISVLTEERFFQGSLADLTTAAENTQIPILRKDFVIDAYQVWEAALAGASGVLLIVRVLGNRLAEMVEACRKAGLEPLVEVHSAGELDIALECDLKVIGVNCRDLDTLNIDPTQHARMRLLIPSGVSAVAESGIRTRQDVQQLEELGYDAILVGESLMDTPNPAIKVAGLLGRL